MNIRHLERRIALLTTQAVALIATHADLQRACDRLTSVPGIATRSAVQLLPEILVLPADRLMITRPGLKTDLESFLTTSLEPVITAATAPTPERPP